MLCLFYVLTKVIRLYIYMYINSIIFLYRLLQDVEYISLCYTVNPVYQFYIWSWVFDNLLLLICLFRFPFGNQSLFFMSLSLLLFCIYIHFSFFNFLKFSIVLFLLFYENLLLVLFPDIFCLFLIIFHNGGYWYA